MCCHGVLISLCFADYASTWFSGRQARIAMTADQAGAYENSLNPCSRSLHAGHSPQPRPPCAVVPMSPDKQVTVRPGMKSPTGVPPNRWASSKVCALFIPIKEYQGRNGFPCQGLG